jgi:hypothetical protein
VVLACALALSSLLMAAPASSQEVVTLALVNGERPSGELVDLNAKGFVLRVGGDTRYYAVSEVATVEFVVGGPSPQAAAALDRGQSIVVLRDGQIIEGRLTDIGGTRPLRLTIETSGGNRDLESTQVAQVHLRKTAQAGVAATSGASGGSDAIVVQANAPWTETDIQVQRGDRVRFVGTGDIMVAPQASAGVSGATIKAQGRLPVPNAPVGALIGRVGNGQPFLIGFTEQAMPMPVGGRLFLGVNDEYFDDNTGAFNVTVTKVPR